MTAINVIRHPNAVHVITDGSATSSDGSAFGVLKTFQVPHLNAVIALRGTILLSSMIAGYLQSVSRTYDDLKTRAVATAMRAVADTRPALPDGVPDLFEIVVAGMSESCGPDSYFIGNSGTSGVDPWQVIQLSEFAMLPGGDAQGEFRREYPHVHHAADLDPIRDGIAIIGIQRRVSAANPDVLNHPPGSFIQLTTVTSTEITSRIIHRWPEVDGEKSEATNAAAKRGVPIVGADFFKDPAAFSNFDNDVGGSSTGTTTIPQRDSFKRSHPEETLSS